MLTPFDDKFKQVEQLGWLHVDAWAGAGGSKLGTTRFVHTLLHYFTCDYRRLFFLWLSSLVHVL